MNNHKVLTKRMDRAIFLAFKEEGHTDPIFGLLNAGVSPNYRRSTGETCLHAAAYRGSLELARDLISRGASPHLKDAQGFLPVDLARMMGKQEVLHYLLSLPPPPQQSRPQE
ncbi:unnamed protein product [Discosporangium mesarthrocarpum]